MSNDISQLENQADHHRAHAHNALSGLVAAFAPGKLGQQAVEDATGLTEDIAQTALKQARANPAGLALIGVGAALVFLNKPSPAPHQGQGTEAERIARADAKLQAKARIASNNTPPSASTMRKMLDAGLDRLSPHARDRVIEARLKAIDAQDAVERHARKVASQARQAHESQPFATAAIIAGIGALIGALLPSTRTEDALLGAKRDQLMRSAEAALRAEMAELEARGKAAVQAAANEGQRAFADTQSAA